MVEPDGWEPRTRFSLTLIGAVGLVIQCWYLTTVPPAKEFETSIIEAYPLAYWLSFSAVFLAAILLLSDAGRRSDSRIATPVVFLLLNYGLFFFLPIIRGYRMYGRGTDDSLVHAGFAQEVIATGGLPDNVFYPLLHILLAELSFVGISVEFGFHVLTLLFTSVYLLGVGTMVEQLTANRRGLAYGTLAAVPLLYAPYSFASNPAVLSFLLFPVVVTVLETTRRTGAPQQFFILLLIAASILLFHPVTALLFILLVMTTALTGLAYNRWADDTVRPASAASAFALLPLWFEWYIRFRETRRLFGEVITAFMGGRTSLAASELQETQGASLTAVQIGLRFVQIYGAVALYGVTAGVLLLSQWWRRGRDGVEYLWAYLSVQFAVGVAVAALFHTVYLVAFNPIRVSRYLILFCVVTVGVFVTARESRIRGLLRVALVAVVLTSAILGAMGAYSPNKHLTHAEAEGIEFTLRTQDSRIPVYSHQISEKVETYVTEGNESRIDGGGFSLARFSIPRHLGYASNETARETFGRGYIVTKTFDTASPNASYLFPEQQAAKFLYNQSDLDRLQKDQTVHRVYSSSGYDLWLVSRDNSTAER